MDDREFIERYRELLPAMLERYGVDGFLDLKETWFTEFYPEEQAVYARMWYYTLTDQVDHMRDYYGFPALAFVDISEDNFSGIICSSTSDEIPDDEMLRNVIISETDRNGTLYKYKKMRSDETELVIAYSGRRGSWYVGYIPLCLTENSSYVLCFMVDLAEFNKTLAGELTKALVLALVLIILFAALLIWFINRRTVRPVTQILKNVRHAVEDFVQNAQQFDDLTMLCMEYRGS